jgi:hypothetical protein
VKKIFKDVDNVTKGMSVEEKFKFLQDLGYIDSTSSFRDWVYSCKEVIKNGEDTRNN